MFDFGLRLKSLREQNHLSQEQLGNKINKSKSMICRYESNTKAPTLDTLTSLAVIFHVSLDYLVGIDKAEMIPVGQLSNKQRSIINTIILEFEDTPIGSYTSMSPRQQNIINSLIAEFSTRRS